MQVSSNEVCRFIGAGEISKGDNNYYFVNLADEVGETIRAFADQQTFYQAKQFKFGDSIRCIWDVYAGRSGIGIRLKGVLPWESLQDLL